MLKYTSLVCIPIACCASASSQHKTFAPYLTRNPPEKQQLLGTQLQGDVVAQHVLFFSSIAEGENRPVASNVSTVILRAAGAAKHSGLLVLHEGGGSAQKEIALDSEKCGYSAIAPEENEQMDFSESRARRKMVQGGESRRIGLACRGHRSQASDSEFPSSNNFARKRAVTPRTGNRLPSEQLAYTPQ